AFVLVNPIATDARKDIDTAVKDHDLKAPYVHDTSGALARALEARSTTEAFVLDAARTVIYRGAVDDQYGLGYAKDKPQRRYLSAAPDALVAGRRPEVCATEAPGCVLDLGAAKGPPVKHTYHNRVSRIVQGHCQECHRKGGVAPFPLETYKEVVAHKG